MNRTQAVQLGIIGKILYKMFFRKPLNEAVRNSKNKIDDAALGMIERVVFGKDN